MVDTAVVALVRSGRVRVHSPGQLATADLSRRHPVDAAVLDVVGPRGHRSVDTIRWRCSRTSGCSTSAATCSVPASLGRSAPSSR